MEEISKYFQKIADDLKILAEDVQRIVINKKREQESSKSEKPPVKLGMKSMQKMTIIYKNQKEILEAKKEPELAPSDEEQN